MNTRNHFGFFEQPNGTCTICFYYMTETDIMRREVVYIVKTVIEAQILCDNLNHILPLITGEKKND